MKSRVTIVTAGHLATCPRMLKAADALHAAGYAVRVISVQHTAWATAADRKLHARRGWRWECIQYDRRITPLRWLWTGARFRLARHLAPVSCSAALVGRAFARAHSELVGAILREPQDLIYGGTSGALSAVVAAARRSGTPCALDFEDFHCAEESREIASTRQDTLASRVMKDAVSHAAFLTAGSAAIARACEERFGVAPITINNVFPLPETAPSPHTAGPLRMYWFGQTIGPGRGLEDAVRAAEIADVPVELHLRGVAIPSYKVELETLCRTVARRLRLVWHSTADPDAMIAECRGFDVGLALETGGTLNRALCLTNKALTYPLAGLALVLTDTPGQRPLLDDLGSDAVAYAPGQVEHLAAGLARWHGDRAALQRAQHASWSAACSRWRWDHPLERDALLAAVGAAA